MNQRILGIVFIILGLPNLIYFGFYIFTSSTVDNAIRKNREIEIVFQEVSNFVDNFQIQNKRLPDRAEFSHRPGYDRYPMSEYITLNGCTEELPKKFGFPEPNSYYLGYWRGEWCEFYVSWSAQTTLNFDKDTYFPLGSYKLTWLFFCLGVLLLATGIVLAFRPQFKKAT